MYFWKARMLALMLCLSVAIGCFAPASKAAVWQTAVTTGSVMFRTGPGTEYPAQAELARKTQVVVLDSSSKEWWKISYDGKEGYIAGKYLKLTGNAVEIATATVTSGAPLYREAGSGVLTTVKRASVVTVLDSSGSTWWNVAYEGQEGYMRRNSLKLSDGFAPTSSAKLTPTPKPTPTPKGEAASVTLSGAIASKIANAKGINKDTVGWISVPNTNVDEPILYAANFYYATHDISRKKSYDGVYPYYGRATKNIIVFGHNMRGSGTVFHQLHHLQEAALGYGKCQSGQCGRALPGSLGGWYKSSAGRTWDIAIFGKQKWEVFAMYEVKASEPISTLRNNWNSLAGASTGTTKNWIDGQLKRSQIDFGVDVKPTDQLMTLITCGTNYDSSTANSRLFVFLKNVD